MSRHRGAPILGAHMSTAGGPHTAFRRGEEAGCDAVQLFTRNNVQWNAPPLSESEITLFKAERTRSALKPVIAHANYLINPASTDPIILKKSLHALEDEIERAQLLDIPYLVLHPGSHKGAGEREGEKQAARTLRLVLEARPRWKGKILLETTSGQGASLGSSFSSLARIKALVDMPGKIGFCLDTCHIFAAGYETGTAASYRATMEQFDAEASLEHLHVIHVNDSKGAPGSKLDRHAHIGEGMMGRKAFEHFLTDERLARVPFILETPKGKNSEGLDYDLVNLRSLREICSRG